LALAIPIVAAEEDSTEFEGSFYWSGRNRTGDLKAVFSSSTGGGWDVVFYFDWEDKPHVYTGTATGSLTDGDLSGSVFNEDKEYHFTFSGQIDDGEFEGTHQMIGKDGKAIEMGTVELERK
jgi:hypothetical protein